MPHPPLILEVDSIVEAEVDIFLCITTLVIINPSIVVTLVIITITILEVEILTFVGVTPILPMHRRATTGNKAVLGHRTTTRILGEDSEFAVVGKLAGMFKICMVLLFCVVS